MRVVDFCFGDVRIIIDHFIALDRIDCFIPKRLSSFDDAEFAFGLIGNFRGSDQVGDV